MSSRQWVWKCQKQVSGFLCQMLLKVQVTKGIRNTHVNCVPRPQMPLARYCPLTCCLDAGMRSELSGPRNLWRHQAWAEEKPRQQVDEEGSRGWRQKGWRLLRRWWEGTSQEECLRGWPPLKGWDKGTVKKRCPEENFKDRQTETGQMGRRLTP